MNATLLAAHFARRQLNISTNATPFPSPSQHFYMTFRDAWQYQTTPVLIPALTSSNGSNTLPTTHVLDLCAAILAISKSMSSPAPAYTLLTDEPNTTLAEITKGVAENLNGTKETRVMSDANYESVALEHPEFLTLNLNLFVDSAKVRMNGI